MNILSIVIVTVVVLILLAMPKFLKSKFFKRVILEKVLDKQSGYTTNLNYKTKLLGKKGIAYTVLRPSGKVMIDDELHDAFTQGDFIEKDTEVQVISLEGNSIKVKRVEL